MMWVRLGFLFTGRIPPNAHVMVDPRQPMEANHHLARQLIDGIKLSKIIIMWIISAAIVSFCDVILDIMTEIRHRAQKSRREEGEKLLKKRKFSPIHRACWLEDCDMLTALLDEGEDVDHPDGSGETPLHTSSKRGSRTVVSMLLRNGANPNAKNMGYCTPIHFACRWGHTEIVELLLSEGADPLSLNMYDRTALQIASEHGYADIVELLMAQDKVDMSWPTAYMKAKSMVVRKTLLAPWCVRRYLYLGFSDMGSPLSSLPLDLIRYIDNKLGDCPPCFNSERCGSPWLGRAYNLDPPLGA